MNKQNIGKFKMFLVGLKQRYEDNKDYFIKLEVRYKSGIKEFPAVIEKDEKDTFKMAYAGKVENISIDQLPDTLAGEAEKYDEVHLVYEERGTNIIVDANQKGVKIRYEDNVKEVQDFHAATSHIGGREYIIKVGQADNLLKEIGILTKDGKVKNDMIRKYNQIDHFVELMREVIDEFPEGNTITVLDCGCGKSYLTFVLNYYIRDMLKRPCYFIGLDHSETVIKASREMAKNLGYANMEFHQTDIKNYTSDRRVDMVISLHACDTATDMAIGLGVKMNAKAIIAVPCCHRELLNQYDYEVFKPIIKHGVLKARMADILTDGLRALKLEALGYKVSIVEYISPLETPKNLMIRAIKMNGKNKLAEQQYQELTKILHVNPSIGNYVNG
ncbi:MAG: SAM-dependent methyltransferase [Clostridiaceae bacterium]|nr:SAM-dependent methyltransferase [Clostridiaceae bacterium]